MNHQKVVQSLKQIFEKYGTDIVCKPNNFRSAIFDLLDEWNYKEERLVLRNAIESNALLSLVTANPITSDIAATAMEQLKKAGHLTGEDAEFIARCFIAARGGDPNIVTENIKKQRAEAEQKRQEEQRRQEAEQKQQEEQIRQEAKQKQREEQRQQETEQKQRENQRRQEVEQKQTHQEEQKRQEVERKQLEEQKRQETERKQQEEERKRQETEQKQQDNKDRRSNQEYTQINQENQKSSSYIFEIECKRQTYGQLFRHLGKLYLYQDKLQFIPYKKKKQTEIFYHDITRFWTYTVTKWVLLIVMFIFAIFCFASDVMVGSVMTVYFIIITPLLIRECNRYIHIPNKWSIFRGCTFIFCNKADKERAVAAIKERIRKN